MQATLALCQWQLLRLTGRRRSSQPRPTGLRTSACVAQALSRPDEAPPQKHCRLARFSCMGGAPVLPADQPDPSQGNKPGLYPGLGSPPPRSCQAGEHRQWHVSRVPYALSPTPPCVPYDLPSSTTNTMCTLCPPPPCVPYHTVPSPTMPYHPVPSHHVCLITLCPPTMCALSPYALPHHVCPITLCPPPFPQHLCSMPYSPPPTMSALPYALPPPPPCETLPCPSPTQSQQLTENPGSSSTRSWGRFMRLPLSGGFC